MYFIQSAFSGITHVIPYGYDHILFIISIVIGLKTFKESVIVSFVFTIAHTVSLFLSVFNIVEIEANIIEPIIAFSILVSAIANITVSSTIDFKTRTIIIFLFGLIHGLGFAYVFKENYTETKDFIIVLFGFNLGVELAQLVIVLLVFILFINRKFRNENIKKQSVNTISMGIGIVAIFILINRLLN